MYTESAVPARRKRGKGFSLVVGKEVYKLRDIQRYCKTKIVPQPIPSIDDVTEIKADKILCQAEELLQDSDMNRLIDIIEKKVLEEDYTTLDLAAGLLRMIMGRGQMRINSCTDPGLCAP